MARATVAPSKLTPPGGEIPRASRYARMALPIILALAAVLRIFDLGGRPLTIDELWTLELSTGRGSAHLELPANQIIPLPRMTQLQGARPWHSVWTSLSSVTHPPGYFLLLRCWRQALGGGDVAARMLSVIASLATILFLFDTARRLYGSEIPALWAAGIMAVAPPQIEHAQLARNYAVLLLLGMLMLWLIVRIQLKTDAVRPGWYVGLGLSVFAMLMTHYFAVGAVAAMFVYVLLRFPRQIRWPGAAAILAAITVWLIVWGPMLVQHARHFSGPDMTTEFLNRPSSPANSPLVQLLCDLGAAPLRLLIQLPQAHVRWAWLAGIGVVALLALAGRARRREFLLPAVFLIGTIGFLAILDLWRSTIHLQVCRYLLLASPGLYLLLVHAVSWGAARHALPALALLACLSGIPQTYLSPEPDWPSLCAALDDPNHADEVLIVPRYEQPRWYVGYQVMAYSHYSAQADRRPIVELEPPLPPPLIDQLKDRRQMWLLRFSTDPLPPEVVPPGFEASPVEVPGFPAVVWSLTPAQM